MTGARTFEMKLTPEQRTYLMTCARIRDISVNSLVKRLLDAICEEQLVLSILDDDSARDNRRKGEHRYFERGERGASHGS